MAVVHDFRPFASRPNYIRPRINPQQEEVIELKTASEVKEEAQEQAQEIGKKMRQRKATSKRTDLR